MHIYTLIKTMNTHTRTHLSKHWLLGRAPLWFWLPVKGKQHELLWPKKCIPDQSHMRLALHLYHVSALALRGFEKFRSALREMQGRTSRPAGVENWMKNRLIFTAELSSAFFKKDSLANMGFTCIQTESAVQRPHLSWHKGEGWRKMKISLR